MPLEETLLNARLAHHIRSLTSGLGWDVREEARGSLEEGPRKKPDIVVWRDEAPPMVIENEYAPAATLEDECTGRLGYTIVPTDDTEGAKVSVVFGIRSPSALRVCANSDEADALLREGIELEYAVYAPKNSKWARFPKRGFIKGNVRDFVSFMKPASVPQDQVDEAADALTMGAENVSAILRRWGRLTSFGTRIGEILRQPWPQFTEMPESKKHMEQYLADEEARRQTAKMCAVILINAMAYQQNLAAHQGEINDIYSVIDRSPAKNLTKGGMMSEWDRILEVNYWPIFHVARQLLLAIPSRAAIEILPRMLEVADSIQSAMRQHDVAGIVFQRLIADRKTLKTYYTLPASTVLVANLGVHEDKDWSNPDMVKDYRIADYACGTGGLILAAYQRVRDLHRGHGGSPDDLHAHMMENSLTACDIMPAAVHLSSSLLSSVAPNRSFDGTRCILYPFGGRKLRNRRGEVRTDRRGNPILKRDAKGVPIVDVGSLALLDVNSITQPIVLPTSERMALGSNGRRDDLEVDMSPMCDDLVIMNPPFTRPTKHAPRAASDHVEPRNPAFAAFGTSEEEQKAMAAKERALSSDTVADGYAGLGSQFAAVANNMVKPGGRIALILPVSAMLGGGFDGRMYRSWQKLRKLLAEEYRHVVVVTIAAPASRESSFSADTEMAECIVVAQRLDAGEAPNGMAHFVNLYTKPNGTVASQETYRAIRRAIQKLTNNNTSAPIAIGDDEVGWVRFETISPDQKWTAVRIRDESLLNRVRSFANGSLSLPQRRAPTRVPITRLGRLGKVGPVHRLFDEAFLRREGCDAGSEYPMLWRRDESGARKQTQMLVPPDSSGTIKPGREAKAETLWTTAGNLHICNEFRFNANALGACFTERRSAGGRTWPAFRMDNTEFERTLCVWLNSTLGMMLYWIESARSQDGRGGTTVTAIPNMHVLDFSALSESSLAAAVTIFEDLKDSVMLPANEAYRDPVRQELDRRILTEVLGLDSDAVEQLAILRNQWCAEPTVTGTKRTGIGYNS